MTSKKLTLGVDLGGTKVAVGLCKGEEIIKKAIFPTQADLGFDAVITSIDSAIKNVTKDFDKSDIKGIGIGCAGQINSENGDVINSPNLQWKNIPLAKSLKEKTGYSVKVLNDVRAATLAELKYGSGKGLENFCNIFLGTGVGSGFVIHGKLLHGATNSAGEIGHICLDPEGPLCGCGKKGCLEAYSSGTGMENYVKDQLAKGRKSIISDMVEGRIDEVKGPIIGKAAEQGDKLALESIERIGTYLGIAIANIQTLLSLDAIIFGGGIMALKKYFWDNLTKQIDKCILPVAKPADGLKLLEAKYLNDAVIIGGAAIFA